MVQSWECKGWVSFGVFSADYNVTYLSLFHVPDRPPHHTLKGSCVHFRRVQCVAILLILVRGDGVFLFLGT